MRQTSTRLARPDDLPVIVLFEREVARASFPDDPIEDLDYHETRLRKGLVREPDGMVVLVDAETDEILAWLWMVTRTTLATGEVYGLLQSLYVRPSARGRGLGRLLADYAVRYFDAAEVNRIVCKVHFESRSAAAILEAVGFEPLHTTYERRKG